MKLWQDTNEITDGVWFRVPEDTPVYEGVTTFRSADWDDRDPYDGVGEQYPIMANPCAVGGSKYHGRPPAAYLGGPACGSESAIMDGGDLASDPVIVTGPNGVCPDCKLANQRGKGGIGIGGGAEQGLLDVQAGVGLGVGVGAAGVGVAGVGVPVGVAAGVRFLPVGVGLVRVPLGVAAAVEAPGVGAAGVGVPVALAAAVGASGVGSFGVAVPVGFAAEPSAIYPEPEMLATSLVSQYTHANPAGTTLPSGAWNFIDATLGSPYVFLPTPATGTMVGFLVTGTSSKAVTVNSSGGQYIDGLTSRTVWAGESAVLMSDGVNWYKVAGRSRPMGAAIAAAANQTGVPSGTLTAVVLGTSVTDPSGLMADTSGSQIRIVRDGTYLIGGLAYWGAFSAASTSTFSIVYKTGAVALGDNQKRMDAAESGGPVAAFERYMTAGEVIYLVGFQSSGFSQTLNGGSGSSRSVLWCQETLVW